jgi:hypothetical protein
MSFVELVVDTEVPKDDDIMYLLPSKLATSKYLASNTFDQATIRNCPVEKITSSGLVGIFSCLKPQGKINIIVFQPIAVMLFYDSKQIEANLKLAGFEDIHISDINIKDEKTKKTIQTQSIEATKPVSKRNVDINIEIRKSRFEERPNRKEIKQTKEEPLKNRFNYTTKTTTTTTEIVSENKPRNKTYIKQEVKEELPTDEKKSLSRKRFGQTYEKKEEERPKNRTYVRTEETNEDGKGGRTQYFRRKVRYTSSTNEN